MGTKTVQLNTSGTISNANYIIQRRGEVWEALGTGFTGTGSGNEAVHAVCITSDGKVVAGGRDLQTASGSTINNIAYFDGVSWNPMGAGLNERVSAIVELANGDVIIGGYFDDVAGGPGNTYPHIVGYNFDTGYYSLGPGLNNDVWGLGIDPSGNVYATGTFNDIYGGPGNTHLRATKWNGSTFTPLGTGLNDTGIDVRCDASGNAYFVGYFTTFSGSTVNYFAKWDGSTVVPLGSGLGGLSSGVAIGPDGRVYVSAYTTDFGGVTANYIASWNGSVYEALGGGIQALSELHFDRFRNLLYATSPYVSTTNGMSAWNGSQWFELDIDLPGSATVFGIASDMNRLVLGFNTAGSAVTSGESVTTIDNVGSGNAYPRFVIERDGGTSARLVHIMNRTTGAALRFNHDMVDGERITIDLTPGDKSIITTGGASTSSALDDLLSVSDFGSFKLIPGENDIAVFIEEAGSPTISAFIQWEPQYLAAGA